MSDALLQFFDEDAWIALDELLETSRLERQELLELVDYGVLEPSGARVEAWRFSARSILLARRAARLRDDFGLNAAGMALSLTYLERIEDLERRIRELECQLLR